ncbi:Imm32 family immunity protein [Candidatus Neptunichlamydia sp. REUL1]|uniref:Imm32 family immunity protein n=1 Tax=Candidatus Neptunichlamydia sp. REUL1 TaxID=3064277 RepID=UPI0029304E9B|nr:Imm32 family immunity protein [Candidatus Neptunochlamydia sp. REUL1]
MNLNSSNYLLTFESDTKNELIEVHCDQKGLEKLKCIIDSLLLTDAPDHVHLMTKSWGGNELSDEQQSPENTIANHVKIFKWK